MDRLIVVAREELCLGFALTGAECVPCSSTDDAVRAIVAASESGDVSMIIVEDGLLARIESRQRGAFLRRPRPLLVAAPGELVWGGSAEVGANAVADLVRKALGGRLGSVLAAEGSNG